MPVSVNSSTLLSSVCPVPAHLSACSLRAIHTLASPPRAHSDPAAKRKVTHTPQIHTLCAGTHRQEAQFVLYSEGSSNTYKNVLNKNAYSLTTLKNF